MDNSLRVGSGAHPPKGITLRPTSEPPMHGNEPQKKSPYGMVAPVQSGVPNSLSWRGIHSSFERDQITTSLLERYTVETSCRESALPTHLDQTPSTQSLARAGKPFTPVAGESNTLGVGSMHTKSAGL
jgi:hypothetical protein